MSNISISTTPATDEVQVTVVIGRRFDLVTATPRGLAATITSAFQQAEGVAADWLDRERERANGEARTVRLHSSSLPSATTAPSCKGCGTAVETAGDLCPSCEHKNYLKSPEASVALANQGEPPYHHEGNFRDVTASTEE